MRSEETTFSETLQRLTEDSRTLADTHLVRREAPYGFPVSASSWREIETFQLEQEGITNLRDPQYVSRHSSLSDHEAENCPSQSPYYEAGGDSSRIPHSFNNENKKKE